MNQADRWLLPDGIEELLPPEANKLETTRRTLLDTFHRWGYELVVPPQLEYLESLLTGVGKDLNLQTFKVTDQLTGRMMGLSADITPQVARIDAHSWPKEGINRLCYCGQVLHTRAESLISSRAPMQIGAELFGEAGSQADIETLSLLIESLKSVGFKDIHIDLGHVGIYQALVAKADFDDSLNAQLFEHLNAKSVTEYRTMIDERVNDEALKQAFLDLLDLNGGLEVLERAKSLNTVADVQASLDNLNEICQEITARYSDVSLFLDLAELRGFDYHTGIVFAAYTPGFGQALALGGRYDDTGAVFGRARSATGFSGDLKQWNRLVEQKLETTDDSVFAPKGADWTVVTELRASGKTVICGLSDADTPAANGCTSQLVEKDGQWIIETV